MFKNTLWITPDGYWFMWTVKMPTFNNKNSITENIKLGVVETVIAYINLSYRMKSTVCDVNASLQPSCSGDSK